MVQVKEAQLKENLRRIYIEDKELKHVQKRAYTDFGVTYNTYLLSTPAGDALIGTPPVKYAASWVSFLKEKEYLSSLRYLVLLGAEEEQRAAQLLLREVPALCVTGSSLALYRFMKYEKAPCKALELRGERTVALGESRLHFFFIRESYETPALYLWEETQGYLFTADVFGAFTADLESYLQGQRLYYEDMLTDRHEKGIKEAVDFVRKHDIRVLAPAYGPALCDTEKKEAALSYLESRLQRKEDFAKRKKLVLAVIAAPGYETGRIAGQIAAGAKEDGLLDVVTLPLGELPRAEVLEALSFADAYAWIGREEEGDVPKGLWDTATSLLREQAAEKMAFFIGTGRPDGAYAGGFLERLKGLGMNTLQAPLFLSGEDTEAEDKRSYEYGFDISCVLRHVVNPRRPKLVKCLVCGEIFDASLGICPVCGVGLDQCVPVEEEEAGRRQDTQQTYVIIGGGVAAVSAAEAIRKRDATGRIRMLSREGVLPINRPMLTKDLYGIKKGETELFIHEAAWYETQGIELSVDTAVVEIDPEKKAVKDQNGREYPYDKLILATGAECFLPPFSGKEKEGVYTLRHLQDVEALLAALPRVKQAVVIGGGVLGLEAASELYRQGVAVTILEATPQIIGRQADSASAAFLKQQIEGMGARLYEGVTIEEITGESRVTGVRIADGTVFPADVVIVSCGNRGNTNVAAEAGITVNRSIVVDDKMRTNKEDIFACGDCVEYNGVNYQLWQEASAQGKVAGANAAGDGISFKEEQMGLSFEGFGTSLFALGDPGKAEDVTYRTVEIRDDVTKARETYWFSGSDLCGVVAVNRPEKTGTLTQYVKTRAIHEEIFGA